MLGWDPYNQTDLKKEIALEPSSFGAAGLPTIFPSAGSAMPKDRSPRHKSFFSLRHPCK